MHNISLVIKERDFKTWYIFSCPCTLITEDVDPYAVKWLRMYTYCWHVSTTKLLIQKAWLSLSLPLITKNYVLDFVISTPWKEHNFSNRSILVLLFSLVTAMSSFIMRIYRHARNRSASQLFLISLVRSSTKNDKQEARGGWALADAYHGEHQHYANDAVS